MNFEQSKYLQMHGVETVHDIADPVARLTYLEIDATPDPTPVASFNDVQKMYLGDRSPDDLDDLDRKILADMDTAPGATGADAPRQPVKPSGPPKLDVQKLQSMAMAMSPTARLEIFEWFSVLETAHRESQRGIDPALRTTRYDLEKARTFCAPYLV